MASDVPQQAHMHIDKNEHGSRLDRVLIRHVGQDKKTLVMRLIRKGNVRVNGKRKKQDYRVQVGDDIFLPVSLRGGEDISDSDNITPAFLAKVAAIPVLFEDDYLLVLHKPAGMVVHGGSGHDAGLIEALKVQRALPDLRLAHRLDRDTSGVLLMAKSLHVLRQLTESFRLRDMQKTYFAWVAGHPFPTAARMQSRLTKGAMLGGERMVIDDIDGKESITDYQVVLESAQQGFEYALLALKPHSGRTHQLRVQLQQEGHAILGDNKYASKEDLKANKALGAKGLALHAWRLCFEHPISKKQMELRAELPRVWQVYRNTSKRA